MSVFKYLAASMYCHIVSAINHKKPKYLAIGELINCGTFYCETPCDLLKKASWNNI